MTVKSALWRRVFAAPSSSGAILPISSCMTLVLSAVGLAMLAGTLALLVAARRSPVGYEDEHGFHYGVTTESGEGAQRVAVAVAADPADRRKGNRHAA